MIYKAVRKREEGISRRSEEEEEKGDVMNYIAISRKRTPAIDDIHMLLVIVTGLLRLCKITRGMPVHEINLLNRVKEREMRI